MHLPVSYADLAAFGFFLVVWLSWSRLVDASSWHGKSLGIAVNRTRLDWALQVVERENRVADSTLVGNLMRSVAFLASTSILILGGLVAVLGSVERTYQAVNEMPFVAMSTKEAMEIKITVLVAIFVYSFFKFTWSLRQFNYCCVLLGACPPASSAADVKSQAARQMARVNELAARSFDQGLRGYYFALATALWLVHPAAYAVGSLWVFWVLFRREFRSKTRKAIIGA